MMRICSFLAMSVALLFAGCATPRPEADGRATTVGPDAIPAHWEGEWRSGKHRGMHGGLRCFFTKIDDSHYRARFRANWLAFASSYTVVLETRRVGDGLRLQGTQRLRGIGGGLYHYEGNVTRSRFTATYSSGYDTGTFVMTPARH